MKKSMDEWLREGLTDREYQVPHSYEKKLEQTIKEIENRKVIHRAGRFSRFAVNKAAGAVLIVFLLSAVSISSYAAVNLFRDRMSSMSETEKQNYNSDIQNCKVDEDVFSRELTLEEREQIAVLREQYENEGKFPQKEIRQIKTNEGTVADELYFVADESKFYLPERAMTEEEMLELIDLQEKRDYSVQQQNPAGISEEQKGQSAGEPDAGLEQLSVETVAKLYELAEPELEVVSNNVEDLCYEVAEKEGGSYFVYYSAEHAIERVVYKKKGVSAHQSGVRSESLHIKKISKKMRRRVERSTGKEIDSQSCYSMLKDSGELEYGTVSFYYQMTDGSGCVAVYSAVYGDLYDIYGLDDAKAVRQQIREKEQLSGKTGVRYREIK